MTERQREARRLRLLLARLDSDLDVARLVRERLDLSIERVAGGGADPISLGAAALYLQNLYTAIEEILRRIANELDGSVPGGDDWHRELLGQMALDIADVRPRLITGELHDDLDILRRFRHLVRHAYSADFDWGEMQSVIGAAERAMRALPGALERLRATLQTVIGELEG